MENKRDINEQKDRDIMHLISDEYCNSDEQRRKEFIDFLLGTTLSQRLINEIMELNQ